MAKYRLTNEAVEDLTEIWNYTFDKRSEKRADSYYEMLIDHCQRIADDPAIGKNYTGIRNELFGLKAKRHIIFYRKFNDKPIEITRILYARMDWENRLNE